jgi:hypothetical protein
MALIDISVKIQGGSEVAATPVRIISATAELRGASSALHGARQPSPPAEPPKKNET